MWNRSIKLVTGTTTIENENGFDDVQEAYLEHIPANFTDLTRSDEIMANQTGYTADQNIEILGCNYRGERFLYDEETGDLYEVRRQFHRDKSMSVVLTCARRERGG